MKTLVLIALVVCSLGILMQTVVPEEPLETDKNPVHEEEKHDEDENAPDSNVDDEKEEEQEETTEHKVLEKPADAASDDPDR